MSPAEIITRVQQSLTLLAWRRSKNPIAPSPAPNVASDTSALRSPIQLPPSVTSELLNHAEKILDGHFELFGVHFQERDIDWFGDPSTGLRAPSNVFGPHIDHRRSHEIGNIKFIWEKNRHQDLVRLAAAFFLTGEKRFAEACRRHLTSWVEQNPFPLGPNWMSPLEAGLRILAWVWIDLLLAGSEAHSALFGESGALWESIYWHQHFCASLSSPESSANNHLTGEMVGLLAASTRWPVFSKTQEWNKQARTTLTHCLRAQFFSDGIHREQAFEYHLFVVEMLACLDAVMACHQEEELPELRPLLQRAIRVIDHLIDCQGNTPRYGDEDGASGACFGAPGENRVALLRDYCEVALERRRNIEQSTTVSGAILSLFGQDSRVLDKISSPETTCSGLIVLATQRGSDDEIFVLADAGPLGYLSLAAHGHADALAFTVSYGGIPFLIDPGTYTYTEERWREYFRSTSAHNTLEVDGQNQSLSGGPFLWTLHARAGVLQRSETSATVQEVLMNHDGFARQGGGPIHQRRLTLEKQRLTCTDQLLSVIPHTTRCFYHFHPDVTVMLNRDNLECVATSGNRRIVFHLSDKLQWSTHTGGNELGWYSSGFQRIAPCTTLCGTATLPANASFETTMSFQQLESSRAKHSPSP